MAGRPIELVVTSDVSGVESGIREVSRGFDDVADVLDDVSDAARDTGSDLEEALDIRSETRQTENALEGVESGLDEVSDAGRQIDRDLTQALESIADEARTTGRSVGNSLSDGTREASEGLDQMSDDAASNAREVAASFDGSADSLVEGFQGAAAEMFSGFGPAGAAAGLAVAAGLGLAMTAMDDLKEKNDGATEAVAELARELYEAGGTLDEADIEEKLKGIFELGKEDNKWTFWNDESITNLEKLQTGLGGVNDELARSVIKGLAGDMEDGMKATEGLSKEMENLDKVIFAGTTTTENGITAYNDSAKAAQDKKDKLKELKESIEEATGVEEKATAQAEYYAKIMGDSTESVEARAQAEQDLMDIQNERAGINVDALTAEMDYSDQLGESTEAILKNGQATDLQSEAGKANNRTLIDLASSANELLSAQDAQGASTADLTAKADSLSASFVAQAIAAGYNKTEAEALAISLGLIPAEVTTKIGQTGGEETKAVVESIPGQKDVAVDVTDGGTKDATQAGVNSLEGKDIPVAVVDKGTTSKTQKGIDSLKGKDVPIKVTDKGTIASTQRGINGIKDTDVFVNVKLAGLQAAKNELAALTATRTVYVDIIERKGVANR